MNMKQSVKSVLSQYATFEGRASRSEYWWFQLAFFLSYLLILISQIGTILISVLLGIDLDIIGLFLRLLALFIFLGGVIPILAVGTRRLHDSHKSGWYQLIGLVPFFGGIALIVWFALPSDKGENQYGSL